jgi:pimeloyl-ACP methyl ester carboxylesterase
VTSPQSQAADPRNLQSTGAANVRPLCHSASPLDGLLCFKPPRPQPASLLGGRLGLSHAFRNSCLCKGDSGCSNGQHTQAGAADGQPVFLLHGWPYDPRSFDDVVSPLASAGFRVIVPYLRCFGPTVYRDSSIFRSGEQAALGKDVIDLMDALSIPKAILAGFDWGNRAACVAAALWPERVRAFVSTTGYTILNVPNLTKNPGSPKEIRQAWYRFFLSMPEGPAYLAANRDQYTRQCWEAWSPTWRFSEEFFRASARSFQTDDWLATTVHCYRHWYASQHCRVYSSRFAARYAGPSGMLRKAVPGLPDLLS